jgi:hypothetical protein
MRQTRSAFERTVITRLEQQEMEIKRLKNTLKGVADEINGPSVNGLCAHCNECYLLVSNDQVHCPNCKRGYHL